MFNILYFAIKAKDEDTVIKLLKVIPKNLLFRNDQQRDFWITMLRRFDCQRSIDFLRNVARDELKAAKDVQINAESSKADLDDSVYSRKWKELIAAALARAEDGILRQKISEYRAILEQGSDVPPVHYLRAAHASFFMQDYVSAIPMFESCVRKCIDNKYQVTPYILVDEVISEMLLRLFSPLQLTIPKECQTHLKYNIYNIAHIFDLIQEVLYFLPSGTLSTEMLASAASSMDNFEKFSRTMQIKMMDYQAEKYYSFEINKRVLVIKLLVDWMMKIEKQNKLSIAFKSEEDLIDVINNLAPEKLIRILNYHLIKEQVWHVINACYSMLKIAENPYQEELIITKRVAALATKRNNELFIASLEESPEVGSKEKKSIEGKSKKKGNYVKKENKISPTLSSVSDIKKNLEDYCELPRYYPEEVKPPVIISNNTKIQLLSLGCKSTALLGEMTKSKKPSSEPIEGCHDVGLELNLPKNKMLPEEVYALFNVFMPKQLFMTGLTVCDLLLRQHGRYFDFATTLPSDELISLLRQHVKLISDAKIELQGDSKSPTIHVSYMGFRFRFSSLEVMPGDSIFSVLERHAKKQFFTINACHIWIEQGNFKMLDLASSRMHLMGIRMLELSNLYLAIDCFVAHPDRYLEAIYLAKRYNLSFSDRVRSSLDYAKPVIETYLYQVDEAILKQFYHLFLTEFGKTETSRLFIHHGVFKFMVDRGIFPLSETEKEKNVAPMLFRS